MKVYMVQNNDGIVMAICLRKSKADSIATKIGNVRWHEAWTVTTVIVDQVDVCMLAGSESYRKMVRKIEERPKPKATT